MNHSDNRDSRAEFERFIQRRTRGYLPDVRFFRVTRDELESRDYDPKPWRRWQAVGYALLGLLWAGCLVGLVTAVVIGRAGAVVTVPAISFTALGVVAYLKLALERRRR